VFLRLHTVLFTREIYLEYNVKEDGVRYCKVNEGPIISPAGIKRKTRFNVNGNSHEKVSRQIRQRTYETCKRKLHTQST
jgi:hypothetical protein